MRITTHDKPIGKAEGGAPEAPDLVEAFRRVAIQRGVLPDTYRNRIKAGIHPIVAAQPERVNGATDETRKIMRQKESRAQWRKRHPDQSRVMTDLQVDAVIAANREAKLGGDRRSKKSQQGEDR